ncbi:MAG: hypothetical protein V4739_09565 [Pseudomonadota bacterium]
MAITQAQFAQVGHALTLQQGNVSLSNLFWRLKGLRRIHSRVEKLDVMFLGFISFVLIANGFCSVHTPWSASHEGS